MSLEELEPVDDKSKFHPQDEEDVEFVEDWFSGLDAETPMRVAIKRLTPRSFKGRNCAGRLETVEEPISSQEIKSRYGGGKIELRVSILNDKGSWVNHRTKRVDISGDPILDGDGAETVSPGNGAGIPPQPTANEKIVGQVMEHMQRSSERDRDTLTKTIEELKQGGGQDSVLEVAKLMAEQMNSRPSGQEWVGQYLQGESGRIESLRQSHESQIAAMRLSHADDMKRQSDASERQLEYMRNTAQRDNDNHRESGRREIDSLKMSYDGRIQTMESSFGSERMIMQARIDQAAADLAATRAELAEYRARKDVGTLDKLQEMVALKEAMEGLAPASDDTGGVVGQIAGVLGPVAEAVAAKMGPGAQPQQVFQQQQPQQQQMSPEQQKALHQRQMAIAEKKKREEAGLGDITPGEMKSAIQYLETCFNTRKDPGVVAQTARNLLPGKVVAAVRDQGATGFMKLANITPDNSSLSSIEGKEYLSTVIECLNNPSTGHVG